MPLVFSEERIPLEQLFLDPNNPRLADFGASTVPDDRISEHSVQDRAFGRMLDDRFEVEQLKESIRALGFVPTDRLVVSALENGGYKVIEGNRRLSAVRSLLADEASGEVQLDSGIRDSLLELPSLLISGSAEERAHWVRILQGTRHVPGTRPWGPYQQAQLVGGMLEEGYSLSDVRDSFGLSSARVTSLRRVYRAMKQMSSDPEFGARTKPALFSHFEEALARPKVRQWLDCDDDGNLVSEANRTLLYQWIAGTEEGGEQHGPKIVDAKDFRILPRLMEDAIQWARFRDDPDLTVRDAARGISDPEPEIDWRTLLHGNLATLRRVPAVEIAQSSDEDAQLVKEIKQLCDVLLAQMGRVSTDVDAE